MDKARIIQVLSNSLILLRQAKFEVTGEDSPKIAGTLQSVHELITELSAPEPEVPEADEEGEE